MNSNQKSRLTMGMVTRDYLMPYSAITTPLPNFTVNYTTIQTTITNILAIAELQDFAKVGIADNKNQLRANLSVLTADNARKLMAFAKVTNNKILLEEIKNSESDLKRYADVDLKTKAQEVYDRAQTNLTALAAYGISAATQTNLLTAITAFNAAIPKPRLGIDERKQATQQLAVLFDTLDTALYSIDAVIEIVRLTQVNFYNGYKTARKILGGYTNLAVKGLVTDAETGNPVKGVMILFSQLPNEAQTKTVSELATEAVLVKKTAIKGGFKVKTLPTGTYQVTIKKAGYSNQVTTVNVNNGELSELLIQISKN